MLGQNIYRHLLIPEVVSGPDDQPGAQLTVFGWAIQGNYNPGSHTGFSTAIVHATSSTEIELTTDELLAKFFEIEEPSIYVTAFTPSEQKVENHYKETHQYVKEQKRYMVRLPRNDCNSVLGESKTQALNRAKANERSLIKKQGYSKFQDVMKEYLELGHAQPVSPTDSQPAKNVYHMPVHAVYKESSSTTKVKAVFDASAKSSSDISLNDLLAGSNTPSNVGSNSSTISYLCYCHQWRHY